jgi:hypothetical protein
MLALVLNKHCAKKDTYLVDQQQQQKLQNFWCFVELDNTVHQAASVMAEKAEEELP